MTAVRTTVLAAGICVVTGWSLLGIAGDPPGAMPGDEAMTCAQIAAELAPYAKQVAGAFGPLFETQKQILARAQAHTAEGAVGAAAATAGAMASSADPTGLSSKAYGQAEVAMQRAQWEHAMAQDKPLFDQANRQTNQAVAQTAPMQSNTRIQRLMQLAQQKNCH
jgi:hypothetical protein